MSYCFEKPAYDNFDQDGDYTKFYDRLREGQMPTTSQSNVAEYTEYFDRLTAQNPDKDIVHIVLSSGLSGTCGVAQSVADEKNEQLKAKRIYVVDSLAATQGQRMLLNFLEKFNEDGLSAADAAEKIAELRDRQHHFVLARDLFHLYRGGRLSKAAAAVGSVLHINPIIVIDTKGRLKAYDKVIGYKKAIKYFVTALKKHGADLANYPLYIAYSNREMADDLMSALKEKHPELVPTVGWIGPVIGTHTGPDTLGMVFIGNKRLAFNK